MAADINIFWELDKVLEPINILNKKTLNNEPIIRSYIAMPAFGRKCKIIIKRKTDRAIKDIPHYGSHLYMVMGTSIHLVRDEEAKNFTNRSWNDINTLYNGKNEIIHENLF